MLQRIDAVTADDLTSQVANKVPEGTSLEYKERLPNATSSDKKEFLADVSSLANTVGGWILYGIAEERDEDGRPTGIPRECRGLEGNSEAELLRLDSMARDGIEPRINGLRFRAVPVSDTASVIACWVPKSLLAPHMVVFEGASRFWARGASGKYQLDVQQLRQAFVASEGTRERLRAFRLERIARAASDDLAVPVRGGPRALLHVFPVDAFDGGSQSRAALDLTKVKGSDLFGFARYESRFNFDGLIGVRSGKDVAHEYLQVFRNGVVEFVRPLGAILNPGSPFLPSQTIELDLIRQLEVSLRGLQRCGICPPLLVTLSCTGMKGAQMALPEALAVYANAQPFDRDVLPLPDVWVDELPAPLDFQGASKLLRGPFDALWQSAGLDASPYFKPDGSWGRYCSFVLA